MTTRRTPPTGSAAVRGQPPRRGLQKRLHLVGTVVVALLVLLLLTSGASYVDAASQIEIDRPLQFQKGAVKLVDANFEHQTQASTGMTTGTWLLWFYDSGDKTLLEGGGKQKRHAQDDVEEELGPPIVSDPDYWDERNLVLGVVHAQLARETVKRFRLVSEKVGDDEEEGDGAGTTFPCFLLLHKHKLYRYDGPLNWNNVQEFVASVYDGTRQGGEPIPSPRTHAHKLWDLLRETVLGHIVLAGLGVVLLAFVVYAVAVARLMASSKPKKKKA